MNDFNKMLNKIGKAEEIQELRRFIKDPKMQKKVVDFVNENGIDCNHLWEDSEKGNKSTDDWHKLIEFVLSLIPD